MEHRLNILWVKMGGLWPITSGGRLRSFHIIDELSRQNDVTVLTTSDSESENAALSSHLTNCRRVKSFLFKAPKKDSKRFIRSLAASWLTPLPVDLYKYQCPALRREVESELVSGNFDLCIADFLTSVPNIPVQDRTPLILFSHNVEYMIWRRLHDNEKNWLKRLLLAIEWRKMRRSETQACNAAAATIAVSKEDAQLLQQRSPDARITSVVTGVDINFFKPDTSKGKDPTALVFSGSMDWHPNEDAMLHFMERVLPIIRQEIPDVRLSIVGRNPTARLQAAAGIADVEVTGTVADIRPWLHRAAVYIVPLRVGGGTRLKIYEALAMGKAVVSTTIGAEGLKLRNDVHLLRADGDKEFARQTVRLLRNPELAQNLGAAGRQLMEANYAWSQVARQFDNLCREVLPSAQDSTYQPSELKHSKESL